MAKKVMKLDDEPHNSSIWNDHSLAARVLAKPLEHIVLVRQLQYMKINEMLFGNSGIIMKIIIKQSRWNQVCFKMSCCGAYVLSKNLSLRICSYGQNVVYPYISNWRDVRVLKGLRNEEWSIWKNVFYFLSEGDTCVRTSHVLIFWAK